MATIIPRVTRPKRLQRTLIAVAFIALFASRVGALDTVNLALSNKNFQMILYPIAQERGYMQEEGIEHARDPRPRRAERAGDDCG
jgi:hypothetical protein